MISTHNSYRTNFFVATVIAVGISGPWFWLTWRYGFDLRDEGFYWYGAQRVLRGEVPLRDFMSYDVGRYYWAAAFMRLMGDDGPFAARLSAAVYQTFGTLLGVFTCLLALQREGAVRWLFALLAAFILTIWAIPYYKVYDHATSIIVVAMLVLLLKTPKPAAWLFAGICLGIAAIMGRNHGVYGAVASIFVIPALLVLAPSRRALADLCGYFVLGVLLGFSPTLIMMLAVDGFTAAFINSIVLMFKHSATNIALPVPWPWSVKLGGGVTWTTVAIFTGIGFIFLLAFPLVGILALAFKHFDLNGDARKVFVATIAAAIPYAHYAFSRADIIHLSLGIFPALIGLMATGGLMKGLRPLVLAVSLLGVSLVTLCTSNAYLSHSLNKIEYVKTDIAGEKLWISRDLPERLQLIIGELKELTNTSGKFLALPDMPSIHAIFRTKMPIWEIYPLFPRDRDFEMAEIKRLESSLPELVLLSDHALDGNSEFRYSRMHPLTYAWLISRYRSSDDNPKLKEFNLKVYLLDRSTQ
ncbi:MAG: hypothetical protein K0S36_225 [Nitrosospira multiformis]|jgi:hypothetical protein|nr:hypothetical protein [Nitrosospira multiformis]